MSFAPDWGDRPHYVRRGPRRGGGERTALRPGREAGRPARRVEGHGAGCTGGTAGTGTAAVVRKVRRARPRPRRAEGGGVRPGAERSGPLGGGRRPVIRVNRASRTKDRVCARKNLCACFTPRVRTTGSPDPAELQPRHPRDRRSASHPLCLFHSACPGCSSATARLGGRHPAGPGRPGGAGVPLRSRRSPGPRRTAPARVNPRAGAMTTDESACTPGSVSRGPCGPRGGGHPSGTGVTTGLVRSTRGLGRAALGRPRRAVRRQPLLTLLRVGFTEPSGSPRTLVVSYTTVSPLPGASRPRRSAFCGTFPRVTPGGCYPPPCPVEPGRSSAGPRKGPRRDRPAGSSAVTAMLPAGARRPCRAGRSAAGRATRPVRSPRGRCQTPLLLCARDRRSRSETVSGYGVR